MRIAVFLMLLVSPLLFGDPAEAANCTPTAMRYTLQSGAYGIFVPNEEMRLSPTWLPDDGEPPLPPWRAAQILDDWASRAYAEQGGARINVIELRRQFCRVDTDRWEYWIQFVVGADCEPCSGEGHFAVVLLNGRLYPPEKRDPPSRNDWYWQ